MSTATESTYISPNRFARSIAMSMLLLVSFSYFVIQIPATGELLRAYTVAVWWCVSVITLIFAVTIFVSKKWWKLPVEVCISAVLLPGLLYWVGTILQKNTTTAFSYYGLAIFALAVGSIAIYRFPKIADIKYKKWLLGFALAITVCAGTIVRIGLYQEALPQWGALLLNLVWSIALIAILKRSGSTTSTLWEWNASVKKRQEKTPFARPGTHYVWIILTVLIILIGSWHRIAAVDTFAFQNDEYYHVDAAKGYIETGDYLRWDWVQEETGEPYVRAKVYTWQVAQSIRLFGESEEWVFRLPTLLWGIIFLFLAPLLILVWTRRWDAAAAVSALVAFDNGFIWSSNYTRMYGMLTVVSLLVLYILSIGIRKQVPAYIARSSYREVLWRAGWIVVALFVAYLGREVHFVNLLYFPSVAVMAVFFLFIVPLQRVARWLLGIGVGFCALAVIVELFIQRTVPYEMAKLRFEPVQDYLMYPFQMTLLPGVLILFLLFVLVQYSRWKDYPRWLLVSIGTSVPILLFFTFFADRYGARKYALFSYLSVFVVLIFLWLFMYRAYTPKTRTALFVFVLCFWSFIPFSLPGVGESPLFAQARADKTHIEAKKHDYLNGYAMLAEQVNEGEPVLMLSTREYYLQDYSFAQYITPLPPQKEYTLEDLQAFEQGAFTGWVVWPRHKQYHLKRGVREHVVDTMEEVELGDSNIRAFRWQRNSEIDA